MMYTSLLVEILSLQFILYGAEVENSCMLRKLVSRDLGLAHG